MAKSWQPNILGFSILQLLERFSLSGYDVKKRFATSLAYGWYAHNSQIYPQLRQLEDHGLVESPGRNEHRRAGSAGLHPDRAGRSGVTRLAASAVRRQPPEK